jgi:hypothetical protein
LPLKRQITELDRLTVAGLRWRNREAIIPQMACRIAAEPNQ